MYPQKSKSFEIYIYWIGFVGFMLSSTRNNSDSAKQFGFFSSASISSITSTSLNASANMDNNAQNENVKFVTPRPPGADKTQASMYATPMATAVGTPATFNDIRNAFGTTPRNGAPDACSVYSTVTLVDDTDEETRRVQAYFRSQLREMTNEFVRRFADSQNVMSLEDDRAEARIDADWKRTAIIDALWKFVTEVVNTFPQPSGTDAVNRRLSAKAAMRVVESLSKRPFFDEGVIGEVKSFPTWDDFNVKPPTLKRPADESQLPEMPADKTPCRDTRDRDTQPLQPVTNVPMIEIGPNAAIGDAGSAAPSGEAPPPARNTDKKSQYEALAEPDEVIANRQLAKVFAPTPKGHVSVKPKKLTFNLPEQKTPRNTMPLAFEQQVDRSIERKREVLNKESTTATALSQKTQTKTLEAVSAEEAVKAKQLKLAQLQREEKEKKARMMRAIREKEEMEERRKRQEETERERKEKERLEKERRERKEAEEKLKAELDGSIQRTLNWQIGLQANLDAANHKLAKFRKMENDLDAQISKLAQKQREEEAERGQEEIGLGEEANTPHKRPLIDLTSGARRIATPRRTMAPKTQPIAPLAFDDDDEDAAPLPANDCNALTVAKIDTASSTREKHLQDQIDVLQQQINGMKLNHAPTQHNAFNSSEEILRQTLWIQQQQLARDFAEHARPSSPFENGSPQEYLLLMAKFDLVAKDRRMDARAKLLELANWVAGDAKRVVEAYSTLQPAEQAYNDARSQLDMLFGRNYNSITAIINSRRESN